MLLFDLELDATVGPIGARDALDRHPDQPGGIYQQESVDHLNIFEIGNQFIVKRRSGFRVWAKHVTPELQFILEIIEGARLPLLTLYHRYITIVKTNNSRVKHNREGS